MLSFVKVSRCSMQVVKPSGGIRPDKKPPEDFTTCITLDTYHEKRYLCGIRVNYRICSRISDLECS